MAMMYNIDGQQYEYGTPEYYAAKQARQARIDERMAANREKYSAEGLVDLTPNSRAPTWQGHHYGAGPVMPWYDEGGRLNEPNIRNQPQPNNRPIQTQPPMTVPPVDTPVNRKPKEPISQPSATTPFMGMGNAPQFAGNNRTHAGIQQGQAGNQYQVNQIQRAANPRGQATPFGRNTYGGAPLSMQGAIAGVLRGQ